MSKIIGIDLGSVNSCVAIIEGKTPVMVVNEEGGRTTPSVISFTKEGERKVGAAAKRQAITNPKGTVILIKRFMGGTYDEIKDNITHVQYDVKNVNGYPRIYINEKEYSPEELSSMIIAKMKKSAEDYLGEIVTDAVITVPAYFNDAQREATKKAGEICGLNVRRIIAEPTAAILASNIDMEKGGKYMVVDYGGSTLDFSIADISDNVVEILASNGDVYCGGSDLDKIIMDYIVSEYKSTEGIDISNDAMAMSRVAEAAEKAKIELSNTTSTDINLPYITAIDGSPKHLLITLNRIRFESLIDKEINKVIGFGKEALKKANIQASDLDGILLVGGSTRIPKVQDELTKVFNRPLIKNVNVDEVVALGAAVQGSILAGEKNDVVLLDVTPLNLGIDTMGGIMANIVEANTTIPCKRSQVFTTAVDNQPAVTIVVAQGNRPMTKDNKQIGIFTLDVLPSPKNVPQIEVTFDISADGILSVSAIDKATGKSQNIRIEASSGLSDAEIERMKKEAEEYAEDDKKAQEKVQSLNDADSYGFAIERAVKELPEGKITEEQKKSIESIISNIRDAVKVQDVEKAKLAKEELEKIWNPIANEIYKNNFNTSTENGFNPFGGGGTNGFNPFSN